MNKIAFILFAVFLVVGCVQQQSQPPQQDGTTKTFSMVIGHTFYNPSKITVNKGDTVVIKAVAATGTASHIHGVTIDEYGINQAVTTEDVNNSVLIQFVADKEGTFTIYCKTCWDGPFGRGHPNIQGTLEVNP